MATPYIDIDKIKQQFSVQKSASERAALTPPLPQSTDSELDEPQRDIVNFFGTKLGTSKQKAEDTISQNLNRLEELAIEIDDTRCEKLPAEAQEEISQIFALDKQSLINAYIAYTQNHRLFQHFRIMNSLQDRDASYPDSPIFHWSIICLLLIGESLANSYFFAQGSNFGFIGGLLQALLVSLINIGAALAVGHFILPLKNKQDNNSEKTDIQLAYILVIFFGAIIILFNLAVAHYREAISTDPIAAIVQAIPKLLESPFGIKHLDAWMLFGLGNLSSFFAMWKSYISDDIYPGYGVEDRKDKKLFYQYNDLKENLKQKLLSKIDLYKTKANNNKYKFHSKVNSYRNAITRCEKDYQRFLDDLRDIEKACNQILTYYREINIQTRGPASPAPVYFKQEYKFGPEFTELEELNLKQQKEILARQEKDSPNINSIVEKSKEDLRNLTEDVIKRQISYEITLVENEGNKIMEKESLRKMNS